MLWPVSVTLDGAELDLDELAADVQIHHGRGDAFAAPSASTCQLVLLGVTNAMTTAFRVGGELVVMVANGGAPVPRFTGRVTDASLDVDALTVIAAAKLSELGQYEIGFEAWPAEPWVDRVARIFDEAGLAELLDLDAPGLVFNPTLAPRDLAQDSGGRVTLGDELASLAAMIGAAVVDLPDGRILVQPIGERDFETITAPGHDGDLDPADIAYAPVWSQELPGANVITVSYTPGDTLPARVGALVDNSPIITGLSSTLDILAGMDVVGVGIPEDTFVQSVDSSSQITMTRAANIAASKDGVVHPGETRIAEISDTSDLSIGMTVEKAGDLQTGTKITELREHEIGIDKPALGTHQGAFAFSAPSSSTITFAVERAYVTHRDEASIARFGERPAEISTTFVDVADADRRARERLARAAMPRWAISAAPILRGLELLVGRAVAISGMPAAAPATDWVAMLEGWSETITGDDWQMELALSDPALAGYVLPWIGVPVEYAWNELDPGASWFEATSLEAILP